MWFRDKQGEIPIGHCAICDAELYEGEYEYFDECGCRICGTCAAEMEDDEYYDDRRHAYAVEDDEECF